MRLVRGPLGQGQGPPPPQAGVDAAFDARGLAGGAGEGEPRPAAASASEVSDKTEVLARGSSASPGRATAWVAVHAGTPEQRATAPGTEAHAAALSCRSGRRSPSTMRSSPSLIRRHRPTRRTRSAAACSPGCKRCSARKMPTHGRALSSGRSRRRSRPASCTCSLRWPRRSRRTGPGSSATPRRRWP